MIPRLFQCHEQFSDLMGSICMIYAVQLPVAVADVMVKAKCICDYIKHYMMDHAHMETTTRAESYAPPGSVAQVPLPGDQSARVARMDCPVSSQQSASVSSPRWILGFGQGQCTVMLWLWYVGIVGGLGSICTCTGDAASWI